jgi:hypothetical protein
VICPTTEQNEKGMALSFTTLAAVATVIITLSITITYVTVLYLRLPFAAVVAAMVVVGLLNAVLRTAVITNLEGATGRSYTPALQVTGITDEEAGFLFVAYTAVAILQLYILQHRFTLRERMSILAITGISNAFFRTLL